MKYILFIPKEIALFFCHLLDILCELACYFVDQVAKMRVKWLRRKGAKLMVRVIKEEKKVCLHNAMQSYMLDHKPSYDLWKTLTTNHDINMALLKDPDHLEEYKM